MGWLNFLFGKKTTAGIAVAEAIDEPVVPVIQEIPVIHGIPVIPAVVEQKTERSKPITSRQPTSTFEARVSITDPILEVPSIGYFGLCTRSPSKRWVVSWMDSGAGRFVLYDSHEEKICAQGSAERPSRGSVADNGTFSLEDWRFGVSLSGTFLVFSNDGTEIIRRDLTANLLSSGISPTGRYAYCQTANTHDPETDGNKLCLFDIEAGIELFCVTPTGGWAESYEIDEEKGYLITRIRNVGAFRYDRNGIFIDADKFAEACLNSEDIGKSLRSTEQLLKNLQITQEQATKCLQVIEKARSNGADKDAYWGPQSLKFKGLAHEVLGDLPAALRAYDQALALNPKIGVKRKADSLRKKV